MTYSRKTFKARMKNSMAGIGFIVHNDSEKPLLMASKNVSRSDISALNMMALWWGLRSMAHLNASHICIESDIITPFPVCPTNSAS